MNNKSWTKSPHVELSDKVPIRASETDQIIRKSVGQRPGRQDINHDFKLIHNCQYMCKADCIVRRKKPKSEFEFIVAHVRKFWHYDCSPLSRGAE